MRNPIVSRRYYRLKVRSMLPLAVGSGRDVVTDGDVHLDDTGYPLLPATAIAGVFRHALSDVSKRDQLFGYIQKGTDHSSHSRLVFFDSILTDLSGERVPTISIRDGVRLEEGTAEKGGLYNYQIVEPGARATLTIRLDLREEDDHDDLIRSFESLLASIEDQGIYVGAKTTRGCGLLKMEEASCAVYDWSKQDLSEFRAWRELDMEKVLSGAAIERFRPMALQGGHHRFVDVEMEISLSGGLIVRKMSTDLSVDSEPVSFQEQTVIPGSSVAGVLKETLRKNRLLESVEAYFGKVDASGGLRSEIIVHDVYLKKNHMTQMRNSIDGFTGGTISHALYTENIHVPNSDEEETRKTLLTLRIKRSVYEKNQKVIEKAFKAFAGDLHEGFASLGGEATVGRGIFTVDSLTIDQKPVDNWRWEIKGECVL